MGKLLQFVAFVLLVVGIVALPYWYYQQLLLRYRNFRVVSPGVLYRSGQLDRAGLKRIVHEHGIRTIINLRENNDPEEQADHDEEAFCDQLSIAYVRLPAQPWWSKNGPPPAAKVVERFFKVLRDEHKYPRPVLVHCYAGEHRTGAFVALYRIEFDGWSNEAALAEMRQCGYDNLDREWDVRTFIQLYQPSWKQTPVAGAARAPRTRSAFPRPAPSREISQR
jgi:tyrosine-protein phosphatase SIW14